MDKTQEKVFDVKGVSKGYCLRRHRIRVLDNVNLSVGCGEWVSLVGSSGSGKTTLLHLLGTLDKPDSGTIKVLGKGYDEMGPRGRTLLRREKIGLVFQNYYLFPELNALENAALPTFRWRVNRSKGLTRAEQLLTEFGLGERLKHRPAELSGGEQQRVAMARALINDPEIILADEPTGNLDAESAEHIMDILKKLHDEQQKTVVMVTHDHSMDHYSDRTMVLTQGCLHSEF